MAPSVRKHERRQQHENRNNSGLTVMSWFGDDKTMLMKLCASWRTDDSDELKPEAWTNLCIH
ncbi:hypothetical protein PF010_g32837 [Phytophthora fragariae]|uniref:Uncharacterized protein n=2 Tax=Phytophthora fragariae TaxID=53985 RepID=A0A6G0JDG1_9STRA|nr:hypothetical protein PF010_g32837 [Phytophthora fragariae]